jgi:hypothetical protein
VVNVVNVVNVGRLLVYNDKGVRQLS